MRASAGALEIARYGLNPPITHYQIVFSTKNREANIWNCCIGVVSISMTDICGDIQQSAALPGRNGFFPLVPVARATG
jgi:hypothetical protein